MLANPKPLSFYVQLLENRTKFAFTRYGDGEFYCMFSRPGGNCDGHLYFLELAENLLRTLTVPHREPYFYSIGPKAYRRRDVLAFIKKHGIDVYWHYTDVFEEASRDGELQPFLRALANARTLHVGPRHLFKWQPGTVSGVYYPDCTYTVPTINCYEKKDKIVFDVRKIIRDENIETVCISVGMFSEVLIYDLWPEFSQSTSFIDLGSLFDVYAGKFSRKPHFDMNVEALRAKNAWLLAKDCT